MRQLRWLLRAKRWAHRPPSAARVKLVFAIIALCIALFAYEYFFGWPEFLTLENRGRRAIRF